MAKNIYDLVDMKHRGTEELVASLPQGEELTLVREPTNKFDSCAVQVWARNTHVGFIKRQDAFFLSRRMDHHGGGDMKGILVPGTWPRVEVEMDD